MKVKELIEMSRLKDNNLLMVLIDKINIMTIDSDNMDYKAPPNYFLSIELTNSETKRLMQVVKNLRYLQYLTHKCGLKTFIKEGLEFFVYNHKNGKVVLNYKFRQHSKSVELPQLRLTTSLEEMTGQSCSVKTYGLEYEFSINNFQFNRDDTVIRHMFINKLSSCDGSGPALFEYRSEPRNTIDEIIEDFLTQYKHIQNTIKVLKYIDKVFKTNKNYKLIPACAGVHLHIHTTEQDFKEIMTKLNAEVDKYNVSSNTLRETTKKRGSYASGTYRISGVSCVHSPLVEYRRITAPITPADVVAFVRLLKFVDTVVNPQTEKLKLYNPLLKASLMAM